MLRLIFFLLLIWPSVDLRAQDQQYDVLIRNGHIIDGTDSLARAFAKPRVYPKVRSSE